MAGKVMMDRNCPEFLRDTSESAYRESKELIEQWHKQDRLHYAITPRFAPTSTESQLEMAGQLAKEHSDCYIHTHVAENKDEVDWVAKLFPDSRSYLDVYHQYELLRERSVLAHCIYLDETDQKLMASSGAAASFCPSSNLFLGSGLFNIKRYEEQDINVGIGTDVGGGTSFNMLQTLSEAYKVSQLLDNQASTFQCFYWATLGGAKSLYIDDRIGNFEVGKEADFVVLNFDSTPLIERRLKNTEDLAEKLFAVQMLGDDRSISATYIMGQALYKKD